MEGTPDDYLDHSSPQLSAEEINWTKSGLGLDKDENYVFPPGMELPPHSPEDRQRYENPRPSDRLRRR